MQSATRSSLDAAESPSFLLVWLFEDSGMGTFDIRMEKAEIALFSLFPCHNSSIPNSVKKYSEARTSLDNYL